MRHGSPVAHKARRRGGLPGVEGTAVIEELAPGISPTPAHDLVFHGGKTIADLTFTNFYVAGDSAWDAGDIQNIDNALSRAMSDPDLNNVMVQYFPGRSITSTFVASKKLPGSQPATVSQGDVEALAQSLHNQGALSGFDLSSTVFNFLLPPGTILTTDAAPTGAVARHEAHKPGPHHPKNPALQIDDADSSLQGLGGYHGSIHVGNDTVYYAVGVYSQQLPDGTTNGIPVFDQPWKSVVATFYHELNEARTDADVEDAINAGNDPSAVKFLGWMSKQGEEIGDFPVFEANPLSQVFQEVELTDGSGTVPVQFMYSNADHGPSGPSPTPEALPAAGHKPAPHKPTHHGGHHGKG
ncbi:MAG TPA: hypothetical protein VG406_04140 [Isosphaeraceae bacterium]|jgi:hypothetical protein|nr:hypothetical protein [Isosphaeraceae bacterium]